MLRLEESQRKFFSHLDKLGISIQTQTHPPVFTVEEAKKYCEHLPGMHLKNLFLKDKKDQLWLVVAENDKLIDLKRLRKKIKSEFNDIDLIFKTTTGGTTSELLRLDASTSSIVASGGGNFGIGTTSPAAARRAA